MKYLLLFVLVLTFTIEVFSQGWDSKTSGITHTTDKVGIKTANPDALLHIVNNSSLSTFKMSSNDADFVFGGHTLRLAAKPSFSNLPYIEWINAAGKRQAYLGWQPGYFNLQLENGFNFGIMGGNVGIGTANPGKFKLAVEGSIGAREIQVTTQNPFPDYVFEKDYKLLSLSEIEKFVQANKHLPEIPSAKEVEEAGGVNLGEMNLLLLKKVEELTLHMIDQQKIIQAQNEG